MTKKKPVSLGWQYTIAAMNDATKSGRFLTMDVFTGGVVKDLLAALSSPRQKDNK